MAAAAAASDTQIEPMDEDQSVVVPPPLAESNDDKMDYELTSEINKIRLESATTSTSTTLIDMDVEMRSNQVDAAATSLRLVLVLDTNVFVAALDELEALARRDACARTTLFVVPWVVLQELDGLKTRPRVGQLASAAIRFIHGVLSAKLHVTNFVFENSIQVSNPNYINKNKIILYQLLLFFLIYFLEPVRHRSNQMRKERRQDH